MIKLLEKENNTYPASAKNAGPAKIAKSIFLCMGLISKERLSVRSVFDGGTTLVDRGTDVEDEKSISVFWGFVLLDKYQMKI